MRCQIPFLICGRPEYGGPLCRCIAQLEEQADYCRVMGSNPIVPDQTFILMLYLMKETGLRTGLFCC